MTQATKNTPQKRRIYIIALLMVIGVCTTAALFALYRTNKLPEPNSPPPSQTPDYLQAKHHGEIRDRAKQALESGNEAAARQVYAAAVKAEPDPIKKTQLSLDESELLFNAGNYDQAFAVAEQAAATRDDKFLAADWLSRLYEQHGDLDKAASQYEIAANWADSPTNITGLDKAYYLQQVTRINTKQGDAQ